ncbi:hypothetical protein GCM10025760_00090 [Microbacterium yannicii]|uniref:VanZ-like domain-containing protein n=1 Tax=Microbacterium yannicii TaxID=671622 RepID=A0ABP9LTJ9_9MICO|nr:VanZ family protein [Microbacterium yannicii]MCO5952337.1 VanZ family protein [Microbacterium yannicii]
MTERWTPLRRAAAVGLLVYGAGAAVILLSPVSYAGIVEAIGRGLTDATGVGFGSGWVEFVANIALFVPLGLLLTIFFRHPWVGAAIAVVGSALVELVQIVIPSRQPSLRDILANVIGAVIGAAAASLILRRSERRRRVAADDTAADPLTGPIPPSPSHGGR